jgi:hypothetical protein
MKVTHHKCEDHRRHWIDQHELRPNCPDRPTKVSRMPHMPRRIKAVRNVLTDNNDRATDFSAD